jgi:hypothetical protein
MSDRTVKTTARCKQYAGRPLAPCGTRAAYERHLRHGEHPDFACKVASARYTAARRAAKTGAEASA